MDENEDIYIDPEVWLQVILGYLGNETDKQALINRLSSKSNLNPDQVEEVLHALTQTLIQQTRSN